MSFRYYGKLWIATKNDLQDLLLREKVVQNLKPTKDSLVAHRVLASLYARYVVLCNNLSDIYDQTLQVQKRMLVEKILKAATNRLLELQKHLTKIELSEFVYVDQTLHEMKLIPYDIQILRPFYFPLRREQMIQNLIDGHSLPESEQEVVELTEQRALEAAVDLIKTHEKARQARRLWGNIQRDPDAYRPKPPEDPDPYINYDFYHKEDQFMLLPIKRTHFKSNFEQAPVQLAAFDYYISPEAKGSRRPETKEKPHVSPLPPTKQPNTIDELVISDDHLQQELDLLMAQRNTAAATTIQNAFRRYHIRKLVKQRKIKQLKLLRMIDERKHDFSAEEEMLCSREQRRFRKTEFDAAFIKAVEDERARILKLKSPWILEDISDQIRAWFREFYDKTRDFDRYPTELEGGTILVIRGETKTPQEFLEHKKQLALEKLKSKEQKKKDREAKKAEKLRVKETLKAEKARIKEQKRLKKELEKKEGVEYDFKEPEFVTKAYIDLDQTLAEYENEWRFIDEMRNVHELPIMEWISLDKFAEVHVELRPIVDELMRIEHELLSKALSKDMKKKYRKPKIKKNRKNRKKKRLPVDITADKTTEALYQELKDMNVIRNYEKRKIDDFIGDLNYTAYEQRNFLQESPLHCLGDVRDVIRSSILGMGPLDFRKPKSLCLAGPPQMGAFMLVEAMCSEVDAILFDLSPPVVANLKCDLKYFTHLIVKMAKALQPTIMFIDGAHKPFYRRVPAAEKPQEPQKLGKVLVKSILKFIKPEDKVMLVGITDQPWNSRLGKMKKCWEKIILLPRTDCGSSFLLWRTELLKMPGVPRTMEVTPLSLVTKGFGTGRMKQCVEEMVDLRRRMSFSRQPLQLNELLENLLTGPSPNYPMTDKEFDKYKKWYNKANNLQKERAKKQKGIDALKVAAAGSSVLKKK